MSAPQRTRPVHTLTVTRTEWITPHMVRVWAGGPGLAAVPDNGFTDSYVKLLFFPEGRPEGVDVAELRAQGKVVTRTYTIRRREPSELAIDFVYHGDVGLAGPWAASVQPGTEFSFQGPGGAYSPAADADWHLFVGDASAFPAIGAALESLPATAVALAVLEVEDPADEQKFLTDARLDLRWVPAGTLVSAVEELELPAGSGHAFVHGETYVIRDLREVLAGVDRLSISGYWRKGMAEPEFQAAKRTDPV
ncbi:siderophore-interacting protein [Actinokineospora sp. PR83]|uniref:siderophore-interacting protein n=1 Tax=Actinokineospora sp. PR83 TaxID=2884908 RepID=UPI0027E06D10|nr:siderophore-interacting protein [Actinokineospora sp. PR83]MCG8916006.1 siderophore-interacting protein [Actinokineospora sp. PR83]